MKTQGADEIGCGAGCIIAIIVMWGLAILGAIQMFGGVVSILSRQ